MLGIITLIAKETIMAMVGKIAFKAILERAITRAVTSGLRKLAGMTTNTLAKSTVEDIIDSLKGKKLAAAYSMGK